MDVGLVPVVWIKSSVALTGGGVMLIVFNYNVSFAAHKTNVYYRKADVVIKDNKHYTATRESYGTFYLNDWDEAYVHMEESYNPEGSALNAKPTIIFDKDTDSNENSTTLGNTLGDAMVQAQLTSAVDYQGIYYYLQNVGVANVSGLLTPQNTQALRYANAPVLLYTSPSPRDS